MRGAAWAIQTRPRLQRVPYPTRPCRHRPGCSRYPIWPCRYRPGCSTYPHLAMPTPTPLQQVPHRALPTPPRLQQVAHRAVKSQPQAAAGTPSSRADAAPAAAGSPPGLADAAAAGVPPTCPRAAAGSPGPPYVQLHDLPAAGRRRGEAAAVPARHVCGRRPGPRPGAAGRRPEHTRSTEPSAASRLAPASPAECPSRPPPLAAAGRRPGPARPLLRARSPPWRPPQPSGGRVAAWDKTAQRWRFTATEESGRGLREGGVSGGRRVPG